MYFYSITISSSEIRFNDRYRSNNKYCIVLKFTRWRQMINRIRVQWHNNSLENSSWIHAELMSTHVLRIYSTPSHSIFTHRTNIARKSTDTRLASLEKENICFVHNEFSFHATWIKRGIRHKTFIWNMFIIIFPETHVKPHTRQIRFLTQVAHIEVYVVWTISIKYGALDRY